MTEEVFARPIFRVESVAASVTYYCDVLGFSASWSFPDGAPIIAQVGRNGIELILDSGSVVPKPAATSVLSLTLHTPENLSALHAELESRGARIVAPPFEVGWQPGIYQFDVDDLDGDRVVFWGEPPADA